MNPTQGNDPRLNEDKPATTWQSYDIKINVLTVHLTDDKDSPIYFEGIPQDYKGGAVKQDVLE